MNIDVAKLQARADVLRIRMAALRAAWPEPEGDVKFLFDLMFGLAEDTIETIEYLADVTDATDRALKD